MMKRMKLKRNSFYKSGGKHDKKFKKYKYI